MTKYEQNLRDDAMTAAVQGLASSGDTPEVIAEEAWKIAWAVVEEHRRRKKKFSREKENY